MELDGWLTGDGDDEGVYVANDGNVGIGTTNARFKVNGRWGKSPNERG